MLVLAALSGCTGGGEEDYEMEVEEEHVAMEETPAMEEAPVMEETPAMEEAPVEEVALHAEDRCGTCHDAHATEDLAATKAAAFEKFPGHVEMCSECHEVETHCAQEDCHPLPAVMVQEEEGV